jgi:hypothetical protein
MVGGATSAFISRRLRAAQPRTLRDHGIDPSGIAVGRTFAIGLHHSVFHLISVSSTTRKIFGFSPSGHEKISTRWNTRNDLSLAQRAVKKRAHFRASGKSLTWAMLEDSSSLVVCGNLLSKASRNAAARLAGTRFVRLGVAIRRRSKVAPASELTDK